MAAGAESSSKVDNCNTKSGSSRVSVSTVALFTLAMAAATGLGAVPFFFVELDPQWAGLCNGMAAGVMLAASFNLIQEGQEYGSGSWVVTGILAGRVFIWLCKKFLEQYGEVSMLDLKGADATKVVLVIGIYKSSIEMIENVQSLQNPNECYNMGIIFFT
ncbi:putative zinc transporter At3g08650 [Medicago truncatula]|uniref:ZIP metal ion transporter family protein, putative n=1 Tax=Medicago truncatula TaxID=3880 RepID=G7JAA4_MEDTR|nr:putative zinc transporter At3g08650 [Medicago truncatula]AES72736.1 ZIP metal ion transporter family protein, putative [Medicago truncatula]